MRRWAENSDEVGEETSGRAATVWACSGSAAANTKPAATAISANNPTGFICNAHPRPKLPNDKASVSPSIEDFTIQWKPLMADLWARLTA